MFLIKKNRKTALRFQYFSSNPMNFLKNGTCKKSHKPFKILFSKIGRCVASGTMITRSMRNGIGRPSSNFTQSCYIHLTLIPLEKGMNPSLLIYE